MNDQALVRLARDLGASDAAVVTAASLIVDDALANHCTPAKCPFYGQSAGCPPHVAGPDGFRSWQSAFQNALVITIQVPTTRLRSSRCEADFRRLHRIAASVERHAMAMGRVKAMAFAGGSCKQLFCGKETDCAVLARGARCRHPDCARPSMSGFGIDVARLMLAAGWAFTPAAGNSGTEHPPNAPICALVLMA